MVDELRRLSIWLTVCVWKLHTNSIDSSMDKKEEIKRYLQQ